MLLTVMSHLLSSYIMTWAESVQCVNAFISMLLWTVSLLDSLDSTLDNDKKAARSAQRTSGDMSTIQEMTAERGTATGTVSNGFLNSADHAVTGDRLAAGSGRRLSSTWAGVTLNDDRSSGNVAGKTLSGQYFQLFFRSCTTQLEVTLWDVLVECGRRLFSRT